MISGEGPGEGVGCQGPRGVRLIDWGCWPDPVRLLCPALAPQSSWAPTPGACLGQAYASPPEAPGLRGTRTTGQRPTPAAASDGTACPSLAAALQPGRPAVSGGGGSLLGGAIGRVPMGSIAPPPGSWWFSPLGEGPGEGPIWSPPDPDLAPGVPALVNPRGPALSWSKGPFEAPQGGLAWDGWGDSGITADCDLPGSIRAWPGDRLPPLTPSRLGPSLGS